MIHQITTPFGNISTYAIFVVLGVFTLLAILHISLKKANDRSAEETFIIPRIAVCGLCAYGSAGLFDAIFKFWETGSFQFGGITFYGGLIGAIIALYVQLRIVRKKQATQYTIEEWFDLLTLPLIGFHCLGRIGCFFAGCCYGKQTDSIWGVVFPDIPELGLIHNGISRYPTQLFEAFALLLIFFAILLFKHRFRAYLICYAIARFFLEFLRGDNRGFISRFISPAQGISLCIIFVILLCGVIRWLRQIALASSDHVSSS